MRRKEESNGSSSTSTRSKKRDGSESSSGSKRSDSSSPSASRRKNGETEKKADGRRGSDDKNGQKQMEIRARHSETTKQRGVADERKKGKAFAVPGVIMKNIFTELPKLTDVSVAETEREELCRKKVQLCCKVYDFNVDSMTQEKEGKRQTLHELVEYINTKDIVVGDALMQDCIQMFSENLFRALIVKERSPWDIIDPEDDDPYLDKAWPHIELVYEFLLRYISCKEIDAKLAAKSLDQAFVSKLLALLDSDDARERDYVKMIMQRIYSKFISLRTFIRRAIQSACLKVTYEHEMQNGVGELLEIMQNIISGFKVPLKSEHRNLLHTVLLPLHKVRSLPFFHQQLMSCMTLYCEKDPRCIQEIIAALLHLWPNSMAVKQVLFLDEIEDLLNTRKSLDFNRFQERMVKRLAICMTSPHSQVAERALSFWKNDQISKLFYLNRKVVYPIVIRALYTTVRTHWHGNVHARTFEVFKMLIEHDQDLFDECSADYRKLSAEDETKEDRRSRRWKKLEDLHNRKGGSEGAAKYAEGQRIAYLANGLSCVLLCQRGVVPLTKGRYGVGVSYERGKAPVELSLQALAISDTGSIIDAVHDYKEKAVQGAIFSSSKESVGSLLTTSVRASASMRASRASLIAGDMPLEEEASDTPTGTTRDSSPKGPSTTMGGSPRVSAKTAGRTSVLGTRSSAIIWAQLTRIPQNVRMIVFVIAAYHRGHIRDAASPTISVVEAVDKTFVAQFALTLTSSDVGAIAIMKRTGSSWSFMRVEDYCKTGRHFMDMIEPTLGNLVRQYVPGAPKKQKVSLPMHPGTIVTLPSAITTKWLFVGVGWDLSPQAAEGVDLEAGAILIDSDYSEVTVISSPEATEKVGIRHGGNGLLSVGMTFDLDVIPQKVQQIIIAGCIRHEEQTFVMVQNPHCRVIDRGGMELARYHTQERSYRSGLIFARLFREVNKKRWSFQAIGQFTEAGVTLQQMAEEYRGILTQSGRALQEDMEAGTILGVAKEAKTNAAGRRRHIVSL